MCILIFLLMNMWHVSLFLIHAMISFLEMGYVCMMPLSLVVGVAKCKYSHNYLRREFRKGGPSNSRWNEEDKDTKWAIEN